MLAWQIMFKYYFNPHLMKFPFHIFYEQWETFRRKNWYCHLSSAQSLIIAQWGKVKIRLVQVLNEEFPKPRKNIYTPVESEREMYNFHLANLALPGKWKSNKRKWEKRRLNKQLLGCKQGSWNFILYWKEIISFALWILQKWN